MSVAPLSVAAVSETSSISVLREKVVAKTVTDSNEKTVPAISNTGNGKETILNESHDKMAPITATPCAPPVKTRQSTPSAEEKEVNIQVRE